MGAPIAAIICAAGSSKRMGGIKKEYIDFPSPSKGEPSTVLASVVAAFASCERIGPIIIAVPTRGEDAALASLSAEQRSLIKGRIFFVQGGATRRSSVHNALLHLKAGERSAEISQVLIHDGARPWVSSDLIERVIEASLRYGAVIPALPLTETPKELFPRDCNPLDYNSADCCYAPPGAAAENKSATPDAQSQNNFLLPGAAAQTSGQVSFIKRHLKRRELCSAQTPQGFKFPEILLAHEKAAEREKKENIEYTDDAEVWGEFIGQVAVISGDPANKKITYPEDLL